jgi:hypothetical protein
MQILKQFSKRCRFQDFFSFQSLAFVFIFFAALSFGKEPEKSGQTVSGVLPNGIYGVIREAPTQEEARGGDAACTVLRYDKKYSDSTPDEPLKYVAIETSSFVPLKLEGAPEASKDGAGKTLLGVTLKEEYTKILEDFSRTHLGGRIAILLDGEIITLHKVRSVISGGQFIITRCNDNACEILKSKLMK